MNLKPPPLPSMCRVINLKNSVAGGKSLPSPTTNLLGKSMLRYGHQGEARSVVHRQNITLLRWLFGYCIAIRVASGARAW